jgi:hypothetical protein
VSPSGGRRAHREPAPDAFGVADPEALADKGVQVDAASDDVASSVCMPESVAVGQGTEIEARAAIGVPRDLVTCQSGACST